MIKQKGFTLIELLVVMAIIGILAAFVLVALGDARDKANDARVKSDVGQMRVLAEVFYDQATTYAGLGTCVDTPTSANCNGGIEASIISLKSDLKDAVGTNNDLDVNSSSAEFCISHNLKSDDTTYICVDATGAFSAASTSATCGDTVTLCP